MNCNITVLQHTLKVLWGVFSPFYLFFSQSMFLNLSLSLSHTDTHTHTDSETMVRGKYEREIKDELRTTYT